MHPALQLEEILLNIFGHCYQPNYALVPDMVSAATTCRAFKEPALDVLWGELLDPSPLVRCLPDASYRRLRKYKRTYSFHRSLTDEEWKVLRGYARRVLSMGNFTRAIDDKVITILADPPIPEPLFSNLRRLRYCLKIKPNRLLQLPFPSLTRLKLQFSLVESFHSLQDVLQPLSAPPVEIRSFILEYNWYGQTPLVDAASINYIRGWICQWRNLESFVCPQIPLDMHTLHHLSHISTLSQLDFILDQTSPSFKTPFFFPRLQSLGIEANSLGMVSDLLSISRLPALTEINVYVYVRPSPQVFQSFLCGIQTSGAAHKIETLWLDQDILYEQENIDDLPCLTLDDLRPCKFFRNIRDLRFDTEWNVSLSTEDLLSLATSWLHLKRLWLNGSWGWNMDSTGVTPEGFLQLLQICPSLCYTVFAWDTRGYTNVPPNGWLACDGLLVTPPVGLHVDVIDSRIELENIPSVTALFTEINAKCPSLSASAWKCEWRASLEFTVCQEQDTRWKTVFPESIQGFKTPPAFVEYETWPDHLEREGEDSEDSEDGESDTDEGEEVGGN